MANEVLVTRDGAILVVTINRPQARNSIDSATAVLVSQAMDELDSDDALTIGILTGAGGNFCSGMDLKAFLRGERPHVAGKGFAGVTQAPPKKPLIAAVEGYALAGGCELVLSCDMVVAADNAKFGIPEVTRGLVAGAGGLFRLPARIPRQIAYEYALTGQHFSAIEAHKWGLVNRLTAPGGALAGALELAKQIAANGPLAVRATKQIMVESTSWPEAELWSRQSAIMDPVFASSDAKEGALAFAEKRAPKWTGK